MEPLDSIPPAEAEHQPGAASFGSMTQTNRPPKNPGRFKLAGDRERRVVRRSEVARCSGNLREERLSVVRRQRSQPRYRHPPVATRVALALDLIGHTPNWPASFVQSRRCKNVGREAGARSAFGKAHGRSTRADPREAHLFSG